MVREAEHVFENVDSTDEILGFVHTCSGHCLDKPECAHAKGAFTSSYSYGMISINTFFGTEVVCDKLWEGGAAEDNLPSSDNSVSYR
jgi:hypothetical protein